MENELIRLEVQDAQSSKSFGTVLLIHPASHSIFASIALVFVTTLILFISFGGYTRHTTIPGVVEPVAGLAKIFAPSVGVISAVLVNEGDSVKKGQILIRGSVEHRDSHGAEVQTLVNEQTQAKLTALKAELSETMRLNSEEFAQSSANLSMLKKERDNLSLQIKTQNDRVNAVKDLVLKYQNLRKSGFISELQLSQQNADLLDQQGRLENSEKEAIILDGEISRIQHEQISLPMKRNVARDQLEGSIAAIQAEISQNDGVGSWTVVAPTSGVITSLNIVPGQTAMSGATLTSLMPAGSLLRARLYAPSRSLGFIHVGSAVKIKFDAFPYQKFGTSTGHVLSVSEAPIQANELNANSSAITKNYQTQEPLFSIIVSLDKNYISAYGNKERIRTGLQLDADIEISKQKIYQWILEPFRIMQNLN